MSYKSCATRRQKSRQGSLKQRASNTRKNKKMHLFKPRKSEKVRSSKPHRQRRRSRSVGIGYYRAAGASITGCKRKQRASGESDASNASKFIIELVVPTTDEDQTFNNCQLSLIPINDSTYIGIETQNGSQYYFYKSGTGTARFLCKQTESIELSVAVYPCCNDYDEPITDEYIISIGGWTEDNSETTILENSTEIECSLPYKKILSFEMNVPAPHTLRICKITYNYEVQEPFTWNGTDQAALRNKLEEEYTKVIKDVQDEFEEAYKKVIKDVQDEFEESI